MKFKLKHKKRLLYIAIAFIFSLTLLPTAVFAVEGTEEKGTPSAVQKSDAQQGKKDIIESGLSADSSKNEISELLPQVIDKEISEMKSQSPKNEETYSVTSIAEEQPNLEAASTNVAQIIRNGVPVYYSSLNDAFLDVATKETIILLTAYNLTSPISFNKEGEYTFDLNGKDLTYSGTLDTALFLGGNSTIDDKSPEFAIINSASALSTFDAGHYTAIANNGSGKLTINGNITVKSSLANASTTDIKAVIALNAPYEYTKDKIALELGGGVVVYNTDISDDTATTIDNRTEGKILINDNSKVLGHAKNGFGVIVLQNGSRGQTVLETNGDNILIENYNPIASATIRHVGRGSIVLKGGVINGGVGKAISMGDIFSNTTGNLEVYENTLLTSDGVRTVLINVAENVEDVFKMTGGIIISTYSGDDDTLEYNELNKDKVPTALLITGDRLKGGTNSTSTISGGTIQSDHGSAISLVMTSLSGIGDDISLNIYGEETEILANSAYKSAIDLHGGCVLNINGGIIANINEDAQSTGSAINAPGSKNRVMINGGTVYTKAGNNYTPAILNVLRTDDSLANIIEINGGSVQSLERLRNVDTGEHYAKNSARQNLDLSTFTLVYATSDATSLASVYPVVNTIINNMQLTPSYTYGLHGMHTDFSGNLYIWIPQKSNDFLGLVKISANTSTNIFGVTAPFGGYLTANEILTQLNENYYIDAFSGDGGTITPGGSVEVPAGATLHFAITPHDGSQIKDVVIDGVSVGKVAEYTFENVIANHSINATFEPFVPPPSPSPSPNPNPTPTPTNVPVNVDYIITATSTDGGSISASGNVAVASGHDFTFYFTANSGYYLSTVTVDGRAVDTDGKTYTFRNVGANHTIHATYLRGTGGAGGTKGSPKTSDNTNVLLYTVVLLVAGGIVVYIALRLRKQRKDEIKKRI